MSEKLTQRILELDEYQCGQAFRKLIAALRTDESLGFDSVDLDAAEEHVSAAISEEFPGVAHALVATHEAQDPWSQEPVCREFLLAFAAQATGTVYLDKLRDAVQHAEQTQVETAALGTVLIAVGIVMLLQIDFFVKYENIDGKKHLKVDIRKKASSESIVNKILGLV